MVSVSPEPGPTGRGAWRVWWESPRKLIRPRNHGEEGERFGVKEAPWTGH